MSKPIKVMLADKTDGTGLVYPLLASPKLDGVRAIVHDGVVKSRNDKPIPNKYVQSLFGYAEFNGLDGELIVGDPCAKDCFRKTTSGVMTQEGTPEVLFYVFDLIPAYGCWAEDWGHSHGVTNKPYLERMKDFGKMKLHNRSRIVPVIQNSIKNNEELMAYEHEMLKRGYEGVMIRAVEGKYKFGRCGQRDPWLIKLKRFEDSEAIVTGVVERQHNANTQTMDSLGRSKRTSHKANKHGTGTMGALSVRDIKTGVEFEIGTGFDDALRQKIWGWYLNNSPPESVYTGKTKLPELTLLLGRIVKYKYFPTGSKDKPRFPVFLGFRDAIDL